MDADGFGPALSQCRDDSACVGTCSHEQHPLFFPVLDPGHIESDADHRASGFLQFGFDTHSPGGVQGGVDDAGQGAGSVTRFLGGLQGAAQLPRDLPFPDHHRFQAGGDPEQMGEGLFALMDGPVRLGIELTGQPQAQMCLRHFR